MIEKTIVPDIKVDPAILEAKLSSGAKFTYIALGICSGGKDYCWPSTDYLTRAVGCSLRSLQRYLKELLEIALIRISKKRIMGQIRTTYTFLHNALLSFEPRKASPWAAKKQAPKPTATAPVDVTKVTQAVAQVEDKSGGQGTPGPAETAPEDTSKMALEGDKFVAPSYMYKIINNNNIPPTPQNGFSLSGAELLPVNAAPEEGEEFIFGVPEKENSKKESLPWIQAKKLLAEKLSESSFKTWIEPIRCELSECQAVLRLPNMTFLNWVKKHYGQELTKAFQAAGVPKLRFELLTPEQRVELEEKSRIREEAEEKRKLAARMKATEAERSAQVKVENLPPGEKFELLFAAYPVKKEQAAAERNFMRLYRKGELPPMADLFQSIKDHLAKDRWWREKMPPLLSNWLAKKKWRDKPYD